MTSHASDCIYNAIIWRSVSARCTLLASKILSLSLAPCSDQCDGFVLYCKISSK